MIDYYYEFPEGTRLFDQDVRYGLQRGYHPEDADQYQQRLHSECYVNASRIWLENANGAVLVRHQGRDLHERVDPRELIWIKLVAREL